MKLRDFSQSQQLALTDMVNAGGLCLNSDGWYAPLALFRTYHKRSTLRVLVAQGLCNRTDDGFVPTAAGYALVAAHQEEFFNDFFGEAHR